VSDTLAIPNPRTLLTADHERIEDQLDELKNAAEAGVDSRTLCEIWHRVEHGLLAHLRAEEDLLFPRFRAEHAGIWASLRFDHERIRSMLSEIGLQVELHVVHAHTLLEIVALLRRHKETEDHTLHRWLEEIAHDPEGHRLVEQVEAAIEE